MTLPTRMRVGFPQGESNIAYWPAATSVVTISVGATESTVLDTRGLNLEQIDVPAGFDGTILTPQGSLDGVTYRDVYDRDGNQIVIITAANRIQALHPDLRKIPYLKFVATTPQADTVTTLGFAQG
jgi:hypothetical protein